MDRYIAFKNRVPLIKRFYFQKEGYYFLYYYCLIISILFLRNIFFFKKKIRRWYQRHRRYSWRRFFIYNHLITNFSSRNFFLNYLIYRNTGSFWLRDLRRGKSPHKYYMLIREFVAYLIYLRFLNIRGYRLILRRYSRWILLLIRTLISFFLKVNKKVMKLTFYYFRRVVITERRHFGIYRQKKIASKKRNLNKKRRLWRR